MANMEITNITTQIEGFEENTILAALCSAVTYDDICDLSSEFSNLVSRDIYESFIGNVCSQMQAYRVLDEELGLTGLFLPPRSH